MTRRIGVSKAAKLIGVSRSELNKRLLAAGIPTFEGEVDYEKVRCIAPNLSLEDSGLLDRMAYIRALPSKTQDGTSHNTDPEDEIRRLTTALNVEAQTAAAYRAVLVDMMEELGRMQTAEIGDRRELAFELCAWLRGRLNVT